MRFGEFRVDRDSGELFRNGVRVRLQGMPFRVLTVLLEHAGELVTREQLRARIWDAGTFVDAEAGLNTAIAKLREALQDDADAPAYIETLPKRGYRFIASIEADAPRQESRAGDPGTEARADICDGNERALTGMPMLGSPASSELVETSAPAPAAASSATSGAPSPLRARTVLLGITVAALLVVGGLFTWRAGALRTSTIAVVQFHNETGDAQYDLLAQQLTDGTVVALTANPQLEVIGNAAVLRTPRLFTDIQKIGEALGAEFVVLGQVQRGSEGLVVRTHFVRVSDQKHLWARPTIGDPMTLDTKVPLVVSEGVKSAFDLRN